MVSNFVVVGKIYNMDRSINSRKSGMRQDGSNYESQMIWVNINTQRLDQYGKEKNINKTFTIWNEDVKYARKLVEDDIVALQCHASSKPNLDGTWNDYWAVDKFEIIGKSKIFADDEKIAISQKLGHLASNFKKDQDLKAKEDQDLLDADDSILWD